MLTKRTRARSSSSARFQTRPVPTSTPITPLSDEERALDDAERAACLALEARVARNVDQVDLPALPLGVRERERRSTSSAAARRRPSPRPSSPLRSCRAGSSRRPGTAAPRPARSCPCHGGRRRRRCGSFRARKRACGASSSAVSMRERIVTLRRCRVAADELSAVRRKRTSDTSRRETGSVGRCSLGQEIGARATAPPRRAFRRRIAFVCSCETRDSVTPSTSPISRRVSSS